jgi:hypothetical protein
MCDYSLERVKNRRAAKGSKIVTTGFPETGSKGFGFVGDRGTAACLLPRAELSFRRPITVNQQSLGTKVAQFVQLTDDQRKAMGGCAYRDALELPNGRHVLVTNLDEDQEADVLQMPADPDMLKGKHTGDIAPARETITA